MTKKRQTKGQEEKKQKKRKGRLGL